MAKYSTGGGGSGDGESCELCGATGESLRTASVAGATLRVCSECAQHDESGGPGGGSSGGSGGGSGGGSSGDSDRKRKAARNTARIHDASKGDSEHWEDGADYDDDQLPYLVSDYGQRLTDARQDAGLQPAELAETVDIDESDIIAIEQGRATKAGIGGSVIEDLETELDIELAEST